MVVCFIESGGKFDKKFAEMACFNLVWRCATVLLICAGNVNSELPFEASFSYQETYDLPGLPYEYNALEPFIDERTMKVHHLSHHAKYTSNMNFALNAWRQSGQEKELSSNSIVEILKEIDQVPLEYQHNIRNFAGGYFNHAFFWSTMSPNPSNVTREPGKITSYLIKNTYDTTERFKKWLKYEALGIVGSGNLWVCVSPSEPHHFILHAMHNHDTPLSVGAFPVLVIDVWEHAYYLKHQNDRGTYVEDWWRLIDWTVVESLIERWGINKIHDEL